MWSIESKSSPTRLSFFCACLDLAPREGGRHHAAVLVPDPPAAGAIAPAQAQIPPDRKLS